MKKFLLPLMAMLVSMVACQKDNEGILKLEVEEYNTDAKLHLNSDDYAVWDNGDEVWINGETKEVSISGNSATLTGVTQASSYQAVYPASWASTDGTTLTYPEEQTYRTNGTEQVIDAPMAAYSNGGSLKFNNLGSILAVNVTNNTAVDVVLDAIEVTADGTTLLNGTATIDYANGAISSLSGGTSTTTLNLIDATTSTGVTVAKDSTKTFYIALPPTSAKLSIKVQSGVWQRSLTQGQAHTFEASCGYNAPFNFTPENNQIWYTSTSQLTLRNDLTSANPLATNGHTFDNGKGVLTFASNITSLPMRAFAACSQLVSITLPSTEISIGENAFSSCSNLASLYMPTVTSIGKTAFEQCTSLASAYMPSVETIGQEAFSLCSSLASAYMPSVKTIGTNAFNSCTNLASVYVSSALTTINSNSFSSCASITHLYYNRQTAPPTASVFVGISPARFNFTAATIAGATLHVPNGKTANWTNWWKVGSTYGSIVDDL